MRNNKINIKENSTIFSNLNLKLIITLSVLIVCIFFIYFKSLNYEFLNWDDDKQITENHLIKSINKNTITNLYLFDKHTSFSLLTYSINYKLEKLEPFYFHLVNILLHVLNVLLVFLLLKKITKNKMVAIVATILFALHPMRVESVVWISERKDLLFTFFLLISLLSYLNYISSKYKIKYLVLFLLMGYLASISKIQAIALPVILFLIDIFYKRKWSIVSVYEKFVLIYFFFIFDLSFSSENIRMMLQPAIVIIILAVFYFLNNSKEKKQNRLYNAITLTGIFLLSVFGKLTYVMLPFVIWLAYEFYFDLQKTSILNYLKKYKWFIITAIFVFSIGFLFIAIRKFGFWSPHYKPEEVFTFVDRIFLGSYALLFYLTMFFVPARLNAVHPYPLKTEGMLPIEYYFSAVIIVISISLIVWFFLKSKIFNKSRQEKEENLSENENIQELFNTRSLVIFFLLFFIVNIALVLHIIPIDGRLVVADRYSYFAYIGLFAITGIVYEKLVNKNRISYNLMKYGMPIYIAILTIITWNRIDVWKNSNSLFSDVLKKNPKISFAHNNLGSAYYKKGDNDEALLHFNEAIKLSKENYYSYYNRAMVYFTKEDFSLALKDLNLIISKSKDSIDLAIAYNDRGMIFYRQNEPEKAFYDYNKAISINPYLAKAYNNRGWNLILQSKVQEALSDFNHAIQLNPELDDAYSNRGWIKLNSSDINGALSDFEKAIELNPLSEKNYNNRGSARSQTGRQEEAIADFTECIKRNPSFFLAFQNRAFSYFVLKNYKNAIDDYSTSIRLEPSNINSYLNRGWAYFYAGKTDSAIADYTKVLSLDSKNESAFMNRAWIKYNANKLSSALKDINEAIIINSKSEKSYLYRAIINIKLKDYKKALKDLDEVIEINSKNGEAFYYRGICLEKGNKKNEACYEWKKAKELGYAGAKEMLNTKCRD